MSRPLLKSQFFESHSPNREFFRRFQRHFAWSPQVLPVYEWEGLLFVATDSADLLETPPREWPTHWILVEANTLDLENLWLDFKGLETGPDLQAKDTFLTNNSTSTKGITLPGATDITSIPDLPSLETFETPEIPVLTDSESPIRDESEGPVIPSLGETDDPFGSLHSVVNTTLQPSDEIQSNLVEIISPEKTKAPEPSLEDLMSAAPEPPPVVGEDSEGSAASPNDPLELPDGLAIDVPPPTLKAGSDELPDFGSMTETAAPSGQKSSPINLAALKSTAQPVAAAPSVGASSAPASSVGASSASASSKPPKPPPSTPKPQPLKADLPPVPEGSFQMDDDLTPTPPPKVPIPLIKDVAAAPTEFTSTSGSRISSVEPSPALVAQKKEPTNVGPVPHEERLILDGLPRFYNHALLAVKAGNSFRLVSWPKDLNEASVAAEKDFSLGVPSPFRIVVRTEKPYHGYLVQTSYMSSFLGQWNQGKYPEILTVVPIRSGSEIAGFVVALGDQLADSKSALHAVEKAAQILSSKWSQISSQFFKAA